MASAVAPPTTPKTTTSVDPLYTQALAQAKAALAPQIGAVQGEQAASDASAQAQAKDATDVGAALSKLLQPIGPAVNGMYQTAAQNQELAAKGFSQGMQDALQGNTDNLNAMLKSLGQNVQLDSHAPEAGDLLYSIGGYNPGNAFSREGAAFGSAATLQAGDAILKGQQNAQQIKLSQLATDQGFQTKIADLAAKLPGDTQTNYTKLQSMALQDKRLAAQIANDKFNQAAKLKSLQLQIDKYNTSVSEFNAKQKLAYDKLANSQYNADRSYQIKLANLGIAQRRLQQTIIANSFKAANGGFSQKDMTKFETQALGFAQQAFHGTVKTRYSTSGGKTTTTQIPGAGRMSYGDAMTAMLKKGWPVTVILGALNQVYGNPTPTQELEIAQALGPLAPQNLQAILVQQQAQEGALAQPTGSPGAIAIKGYAFKTAAAKYGWGSDQQHYLDLLWTRESGWNPNAVNPSSGAAGIPQALGHGNVFKLGDANAQVDWGLNYIKGRYGSPQAAWAHEQQYGWY